MKMDHAAPLVFGHLGEREPDDLAQTRHICAAQSGQLTKDVDGGAPPQFGGVRVPHHCAV